MFFNSLPNGKILDWTKLKTFADDKLYFAKIMISVYERVENIVGKRENTDDQVSFSGSLKVRIVWYRVKHSCSFGS